jgi:hypothetical protein
MMNFFKKCKCPTSPPPSYKAEFVSPKHIQYLGMVVVEGLTIAVNRREIRENLF